ncbi:MAG TPA: methyltransferase domain-containing protein [Burkholderiales bacterium]|nr:methyltransferase domain-containing protein [Burkholderiales bacterium]
MQYGTKICKAARGSVRITAFLVPGLLAMHAWAAEPRVPYVPTPQEVVERMLQIAKVSSTDYLIDLGSGDGRIVVTAAKKYGARGFGVDLNPQRINEANENAKQAGVLDKVAFYQRDLFETDLSEATVITMYLLPRVNLELRSRLLDLKPGTRIVSHDFSMGDWKPDTHVQMDVKEKYGASGGKSDIYFWAVPAKIGGTWQWDMPVLSKDRHYQVTLTQRFQMISGTVKTNGREGALQNPRLRGDRISFSFSAPVDGAPVKHEFTGKVEGDTIAGTARLSGGRIQAQLDWSARRTVKAAAVNVEPTAATFLQTFH